MRLITDAQRDAALALAVFLLGVLAVLVLLPGCAWIESEAGKAAYVYERTEADGSITRIELRNAKDIGRVNATADLPGKGQITLTEEGVNASGPMAVMLEQQAAQTELLRSLIPLLPASPRAP